eukprot:TRINITY_DN1231_c0_g1_i5.p1 TRINITY_DN1231_c0_g1~~TRINITY_DN1231_c0_g1_i5.p1  ORF type:complete len:271 (-),score=69.29 TRINITY_DN1231_c0_g1_i5:1039-1809(-)
MQQQQHQFQQQQQQQQQQQLQLQQQQQSYGSSMGSRSSATSFSLPAPHLSTLNSFVAPPPSTNTLSSSAQHLHPQSQQQTQMHGQQQYQNPAAMGNRGQSNPIATATRPSHSSQAQAPSSHARMRASDTMSTTDRSEIDPSRSEDSIAPQLIVPTLQNVVSTVNLGCKLDLKEIALHARNAEYNPKRFVIFPLVYLMNLMVKHDQSIISLGRPTRIQAVKVTLSSMSVHFLHRTIQNISFFFSFLITNSSKAIIFF